MKDLPTVIVMTLGATSFAIAGYYGYVLGKVMPDFIEVGNRIPLSAWGATGFALFGMLAGLGALVWYHANVAAICNGILRQRLLE